MSEQADEWAAEKEELTAQLEEAKKKAVQLEQQRVSKGIAPQVPTASVTAAGDVVLQFAKPEYAAETKLIALTFDDGPGKYTDRLLDELKARGVHATFFVVGQNAQRYTSTLKRMIDEGHVIGNHTMNHKNLTKLSESEALQQINDCADVVEKACGVRPYLLLCLIHISQLENGVGLTALLFQQFREALADCGDEAKGSPMTIATGVAAAPLLRMLIDEAGKKWDNLHVRCV